ncbi:S41 family peptidase [Flavobacterium sp. XGLA_31]|uniref:S41 family peptidase n=1 Tax=Flavobacterium sp. XGLA_31 TaxID=3447666 RepID=UPI003F2EBE34
MKSIAASLFLLFLLVVPMGCEDMDDHPVPDALAINDFIWKGMNLYYLWQGDVPDLADNRFANQSELNTFLGNYSEPLTLFNHLRVAPNIDRFSVLYSDYSVLEGVLSGTTLNNGMDFGLKYTDATNTNVFGWVHYVLPNSDAEAKGLQRGDIFYAINGTPLTGSNYRTLLGTDTYTLNMADYVNGTITPNGQSITLTKTNLSENPVFLHTVITEGTHHIGYLMYNGFYPNYDNALNDAFGSLASQNVTDLVLDLRYNSGGSINSATKLASMITGQFPGQLFAKQQWNAKAQSYYESNNPSSLENRFVSGLNGLHLNKVYILTSNSTASASELVINCLKSYITVVQIGDVTVGKNVGSITLYDSPTFVSKTDINPNHKYAMQPIVLRIVNKDGQGDYTSGIVPDTDLPEHFNTAGVLGSPDEPLLQEAINQITANGKQVVVPGGPVRRDFTNTKSLEPLRMEMYLEAR